MEEPKVENETAAGIDLDSLPMAGEEWLLPELAPAPEDEWDRMRRFQGMSPAEREGMLVSVPALFRRGYELVVANYDYLLANPETAQILGWENGADVQHLDERRRFFTIWLARLLGMDFSHDLARYLYKAGQIHAGLGPRHIHVPPVYVSGAASLVTAAFARVLVEEMPGDPTIPAALAGWNKVITLHLHMMLQGYESARRLLDGAFPVEVTFYGRMRAITGRAAIEAWMQPGAPVAQLLRKLFDFFPQARGEALEVVWAAGEHIDAFGNPWMTARPMYQPRRGWRVLLNGRDISYLAEEQREVTPGDTLQMFPPGR